MNRMKKLSFLIIPATAMFFVACNTEAPAPSQADIDAQVEAKVKAATDQLKAECDSRIMAAAQLKKDSILVKMGSKPAPAPAPKPSTPVKQTPVKQEPVKQEPVKETPKPTIGNGKPKMGSQNSSEVGNGKPKMGGTTDAQGKAQDNKVGNGKPKMGGGN
jgi:hypothetical protein